MKNKVISKVEISLPIIVISQATIYDIDAIQTMHIVNVSGYQFLNDCLRQSGIVTKSNKLIGHVKTHQILSIFGSGQFVIFTMSTETMSFFQIFITQFSIVNLINKIK